jgi:hypothetical protein
LLDPFQSPDLIKALAQRGVSAISLEMVPRSTRAQKMDVLSSQASLGWLCGGDRGGGAVREDFSDDDDACGHDQTGEGVHHRRGRGRLAGHRDGETSRR